MIAAARHAGVRARPRPFAFVENLFYYIIIRSTDKKRQIKTTTA